MNDDDDDATTDIEALCRELSAYDEPAGLHALLDWVDAEPARQKALADRIAELERVLAKSLANRIVEKAKQADQPCGHPAAVANRSAETGVAFCDLCRLNEMLNDALAMEAKHKAERDALRDQVEEARAGLTEIACFHEGPEVHGGFDEPGSAQTARDTLAAMDEAKP